MKAMRAAANSVIAIAARPSLRTRSGIGRSGLFSLSGVGELTP